MITKKKIPIKIINKGTGAGGAQTTANGLAFEQKTSIENKLLTNNFAKIVMNKKNKNGYYLELKKEDIKITYVSQTGFKLYMKKEFDVDVCRKPDEAFIIYKDDKYYLKIIEKKNQNVDGSVEEKLKTGKFNIREYEKMLKHKFIVSYAFCISKFLQDKFESKELKYNIMKEILDEDDIKLFYGDNENYFDEIFEWVNMT